MYHEVWNKKRERIKKNDILFDRITGIWLQLNWKKPLRAVRRNSCLLNSKTSKPYSKTSEPYSRRTKPYRMQDWQISRWDRESESWSRVNVCVRWRGITSVYPSAWSVRSVRWRRSRCYSLPVTTWSAVRTVCLVFPNKGAQFVQE